MDVKGLSIQDIIDMDWRDINRLNEKELRELSMRLNSAANKRLRRLEKSGQSEWSSAYAHVKKSGGDFTVKGKDTKVAVKNEIQRASDFLQAKTSTAAGTKKYKKSILDLFGEDTKKKAKATKKRATKDGAKKRKPPERVQDKAVGELITVAQRKKLFRALDRLRENNAAAVYNIGSDVIIKELRQHQKTGATSKDKLIAALEEKYPELMEDSESRYVREQQEYQNRTDEDGQFHPLSAQDEFDNPFIR